MNDYLRLYLCGLFRDSEKNNNSKRHTSKAKDIWSILDFKIIFLPNAKPNIKTARNLILKYTDTLDVLTRSRKFPLWTLKQEKRKLTFIFMPYFLEVAKLLGWSSWWKMLSGSPGVFRAALLLKRKICNSTEKIVWPVGIKRSQHTIIHPIDTNARKGRPLRTKSMAVVWNNKVEIWEVKIIRENIFILQKWRIPFISTIANTI